MIRVFRLKEMRVNLESCPFHARRDLTQYLPPELPAKKDLEERMTC